MDTTEIAARLAIQERLNLYTDAILRFDADAFGECWAPDAQWRIMGQHFKGREQIVGFYQALTESAHYVRHLSHSPVLRIDGDSAAGRFQVTETVCSKQGDGMLILGVYDDRFAKSDGVWRFTERVLDITYQGPFPLELDNFHPLDATNHRF